MAVRRVVVEVLAKDTAKTCNVWVHRPCVFIDCKIQTVGCVSTVWLWCRSCRCVIGVVAKELYVTDGETRHNTSGVATRPQHLVDLKHIVGT